MAYSDRKGYGRGRNVQWRGAIPGEEPPTHLEFAPEEYEQLPDRVKIALEKVVSKLPAPTKKKYVPLEHQKMVLEKEEHLIQAGLDGDTLRRWTNEYAHATQAGRSWSVVLDTLNQVSAMQQQYGPGLVNLALLKCLNTGKPQACTAPYLRAVLKNGAGQPEHAAAPRPAAPAPVAGKIGKEHWERIMQALEQRINSRSFATWLRPCVLIEISRDTLTLGAPSEVHVSWLMEHYIPVISQAFGKVVGQMPSHVQIVTVEQQQL